LSSSAYSKQNHFLVLDWDSILKAVDQLLILPLARRALKLGREQHRCLAPPDGRQALRQLDTTNINKRLALDVMLLGLPYLS
jgi:hypothetical protein